MKKLTITFISALSLLLFYSCNNVDLEEVQNDFKIVEPSIVSNEVAFRSEFKKLVTLENGIMVEKSMHGHYIFQGDIVLSQKQIEILDQPEANLRSSILSNFQELWPNGIVYYTFNQNITSSTKSAIQQAMSHWQQNTKISFVPRTTERNYVDFFNGDGCWSFLGMIGGMQQISIDASWGNKGNAIHEIGHAVGLLHEHCRWDRDQYININFGNIVSGFLSQYQIESRDHVIVKVSSEPFDFGSIMIYDSFGGATINPNKPILTKKDGTTWVAQRSSLSFCDRTGIGYMYGYPPIQHYIRVEYSFDESDMGSDEVVTGGGFYDENSTCTISAGGISNAIFLGWWEGTRKITSDGEYTFIVKESRRFEARFEKR